MYLHEDSLSIVITKRNGVGLGNTIAKHSSKHIGYMVGKKILAFGASNSSQSINKKFATYTSSQVDGAEVTLLDLNDYELPIYSIDREKETGIPDVVRQFRDHIEGTDGIIISFAEYNGAYSSAFKNIFDWVSRIDQAIWAEKPMFLLATSPGGRGGMSVLNLAVNTFPFMAAGKIASFSLPYFRQNFSEADGIVDETLKQTFQKQLNEFIEAL